MLQSLFAIRNDEIIAPLSQYSVYFFNHLCNIHEWVIRAKKRISRWFIDNQIKRLVFIAHLFDIHNIKFQFFVALRFGNFLHLFDHNGWNIVADYVLVTLFIEWLLKTTVTTADIQNASLFAL